MSDKHYGIIWIDHREAKIFHVTAGNHEPTIVRAHGDGQHAQHKANTTGSGHRGVDKEYFERVIAALTGLEEILLTGPGNARMELKNYLDTHHVAVARRISAVEAVDHPDDSALLTLARKFFKIDERVRNGSGQN